MALIERWRPETSTFHLQEGEMTITLQDVAVLLGLHIDGPPVTETDEGICVDECERLLGMVPSPTAIQGGQVKLTWLCEEFSVVPIIEEHAQQHAHALIFHLIDTQLFPDYSTNKVYIRWLPLLEEFDACGALYKVFMMRTSQFSGHSTLLQVLWINYSILLI